MFQCSQLLDNVTYERHKTCLAHHKSTSESVLMLMRETAANRRQWIQEEKPSLQTILKEFPCLKTYSLVCTYIIAIDKIITIFTTNAAY